MDDEDEDEDGTWPAGPLYGAISFLVTVIGAILICRTRQKTQVYVRVWGLSTRNGQDRKVYR